MDRFDLGTHSRQITTSSPQAQYWFDKGLNWCYGFNQEEGVKCFYKALEYDPNCAMAYWGVAYGSGPFYNLPWCDFGPDEAAKYTEICYQNCISAKNAVAKTTVTTEEAELIEALSSRFQKPHTVQQQEFDCWDDAYADAMRKVYQHFPQDLDITALYIEALMTRTPWQLWDVKTNQPAAGANTMEALDACEKAIAQANELGISQHPAILHLHIHLLEMSPHPQRAMNSAHVLGTLCPDAGHMNHMPGHIYVLCGEYLQAKSASEKAIVADRKYVDYAGPFNFYTSARCHDLHLMMYTCMFLGQYQPAMEAADELCDTLSREVLETNDRPQLAITMEGYYSMRMHVLVRFGRWRDIINAAMPECPKLYCVSTAMHHYAKGVAYAALNEFDAAHQQREHFYAALKRIPDKRKFFNNPAADILAVGAKMLDGELAYHEGNPEHAFTRLREAVQLDDDLKYSEPWAWMHPPRHALAALLVEQHQHDEAEDVYRTDLGLNDSVQRCAQHHGNVWALHGLVECLRQRQENVERLIYEEQLDKALLQADIAISSSCCCRMRPTI